MTIEPDFKGDVVITVKDFDGRNSVAPNVDRYKMPAAVDLVEGAHKLTVKVGSNASADAKVKAAKDAYDARQKVLDAVANEAVLEKKRIVPAGGYFVLHLADLGDTGIQDPKVKTKEKISAAQKLYNTAKIGLPFPANDLDNFFRNGGTLNLAYADITAATGSGHDESKGPTGDDATGYTAAATNVYAAGALIINEVMWGLDAGKTTSQYIELYNPGTADIGIDHLEWVITVGAPPTGYTVIDTVGNNPASGYWEVPGSSGVTAVSATHPALADLVSVSRMMGVTDGTAAASWAASMRPSQNLSGLRVGTPGAPNNYVKPAAPTPPAPKTPVAEVGDLTVTEIMVDTGTSGMLPQWIEIANTSAAAVSLMGWSINVDNDPGDATVAPSLNIILGDVDIGANQTVLVVSKMSNRNSGVGTTAGMIRSDRIIDAKVGDGDAILSKMAFRIGLVPPLKAGAAGCGDVAGNLQQGWELPMTEGNARSSLIRRTMNAKGEIMGTDAAGWVLAGNAGGHLSLVPYATHYGDKNDMGSPGLSSAGGALPVELSKFGAKRDPLTGQVTVTWETQSELNNAGFFIKRSQQKNSQFVAVNPTMIPGAGTTSEKQSYTYTDTTAKPNIVYYYQIEDVSLDGNRLTYKAGRAAKHAPLCLQLGWVCECLCVERKPSVMPLTALGRQEKFQQSKR